MKLLHSIAVTLALAPSIAAAEEECSYWKKGMCAMSLSNIVMDMTDLDMPPEVDDVKSILSDGHSFMDECNACIEDAQREALCETIDFVVGRMEDSLTTDINFDKRSCKEDGIIGSIVDAIPTPWLASEKELVDKTAQSLVKLGLSADVAATSAAASVAVMKAEGGPAVMSRSGVKTQNVSAQSFTVNLNVGLSSVVEHRGKAHLSMDGAVPVARITGKFKVAGSTVGSYDETLRGDIKVPLKGINVGIYKIGPYLQLKPDHIKICIEQVVNMPWPIGKQRDEYCQKIYW